MVTSKRFKIDELNNDTGHYREVFEADTTKEIYEWLQDKYDEGGLHNYMVEDTDEQFRVEAMDFYEAWEDGEELDDLRMFY